MDYEIIATLGPASRDEETWPALLAAGATAFRLNTSHLTLPGLEDWLERLAPFLNRHSRLVPVYFDLQGSKWRLGEFPACRLATGERVRLVLAQSAQEAGVLPVPHRDFFAAALLHGGEASLNDARVRLAVESAADDWASARVLVGGELSANKGITLTAGAARIESLGERDRAVIERTGGLEMARFALSYVRDADEIARYRALCGPRAFLAAKLERRPAVDEPERICAYADELWLCRGDLGAELGLPAMASSAADFSRRVSSLPVPAVLAGQVLEHMTRQPTPTRSEICQLYDALQCGYRGFVLSDETAVGDNPVESCRAAAMFRGL